MYTVLGRSDVYLRRDLEAIALQSGERAICDCVLHPQGPPMFILQVLKRWKLNSESRPICFRNFRTPTKAYDYLSSELIWSEDGLFIHMDATSNSSAARSGPANVYICRRKPDLETVLWLFSMTRGRGIILKFLLPQSRL